MTKKNKLKPNQSVSTNMQPDRKVACSVAPCGPQHATNFAGILERLKDATGAKSDTGFAKALGLRQSSVSSAKKREQIPPAWAVQVAEMTGASLDWLLLGKGEGVAVGVQESESASIDNDRESKKNNEVRGKASDNRDAGKQDSFFMQIIADLQADKEYLRYDNQHLREKINSDKETMAGFVHENGQLKQELGDCLDMLDICRSKLSVKEEINFNKQFPTALIKTAKTRHELQEEIRAVRRENQQLREEIQRDRDQNPADNTG